MTIGKRIMEHRKAMGLTQDQLAERLGVTAQAVSKWENDLSCPDIATLPLLADIFGTSVDALLGRDIPTTEAEVVDSADDAPAGIHFQNEHCDFVIAPAKLGAISLGVYVILLGALYLLTSILNLNISLWNIAWPSALLVFGVCGLLRQYRWSSAVCALLGGWFLADAFFDLQFQIDKKMIWGVVILLLGVSLLTDALRRSKKRHRYHIRKPSSKSRNQLDIHGTTFSYESSFNEQNQEIRMQTLSEGEITCSFGDFTVDLTAVATVTADCALEVTCSFGELTLLMPRRFAVNPDSTTAFAGFSVEGQPDDTPAGVISLDATCSFGEITVKYV